MKRYLIASLWAITACGQVSDSTDEGDGGDGGGTPARAALVFPPASGVTEGSTMTVRGTATDPDGIRAVRVNGLAALSSDGFATWEAKVTLAPGANEVVIDVEDERGDIERGAAAVQITVSPNPMASPVSVAADGTLFGTQQLYVADDRLRAVFAVDLNTGARTLVSGHGRGAGPAFPSLDTIAFDQPRNRLIAAGGGIFAVDPATGARTAINADALFWPAGLALDDTRALVASLSVFGGPALLESVNLTTGARTTVSGGSVGTGPQLTTPTAVAYDPFTNRVLVTDSGLDAVVAVSLGNGARTIVSSGAVGTGPALASPSSIALERGLSAPAQAWVTDTALDAVIRIDLATGNRTLLSGAGAGAGDAIASPEAVLSTPQGELLVVDGAAPALVKVHPATGDRTTFSSSRVASGPPHPTATGSVVDGGRMVISDYQGIFRLDLAGASRTLLAGAMGDVALPSGPVVEPGGAVLFSVASGKLMRIGIDDGRLSVVSGGVTGTGPAVPLFSRLALGPEGRVFAGGQTSLLAIDGATGDRTLLSGGGIGTGPTLGGVTGVAFDTVGARVLAVDTSLDALLAIDPGTGNRIALSGAGAGTGPALAEPMALEVEAAGGRALVVDSSLDALISVSLANGNRTALSDATTPGPLLSAPQSLDADFAHGVAYVADMALGVFAIDLQTGHRVIVSH